MLKEYTKPVVTRVNLIPSEAVLGYCKVPGQIVSGPSGDTCCEDWASQGGCHVPGS